MPHHQHNPAATTPCTPVEPSHTLDSILHGRRLPLSATEIRLLAFLLEQQGRVVSLEALAKQSYGCVWERTLTNRLRKHLSKIRSLLAPHGLALYPVEHQGYLLLAEEPCS